MTIIPRKRTLTNSLQRQLSHGGYGRSRSRSHEENVDEVLDGISRTSLSSSSERKKISY